MGQDEYRLKSLADDELLAGLSCIVLRRNQVTAEFLAYLAELDERQLFLELGFSSLFEYCVEVLGLCESTAGRHIAAARVCRNHPQVFAMVASGALHASALSLMRKHVTPENAEELFELCKGRSARKVEELLAVRFPRPDVRDLVRRLPPQVRLTPDVGCDSARTNTEAPRAPTNTKTPPAPIPGRPPPSRDTTEREFSANSSAVSTAPMTGPASTDGRALTESPKPRRLEPLSADRYGVHFTADGEFRDLLERVRGLAGHRLPSGDLMTLIKRGLEAYERELEKERFALGRKPRIKRAAGSTLPAVPAAAPALHATRPETSPSEASPSEASPSETSPSETSPSETSPSETPLKPKPFSSRKRKHYSAEIVREVFARDGKQCTYVSPDGRRCCARRCLELDHVDPWAVGGEDTVCNLRLRCRAHNQWYARQYFGRARVDAAVRSSRAATARRG